MQITIGHSLNNCILTTANIAQINRDSRIDLDSTSFSIIYLNEQIFFPINIT